jgi:antitoxin (DNA-binding transcriptional repressor) of toxin-antitoxin stability system
MPTTDTRPAVGLTGKGRAVALLVTVRERYDSLSPDQQREVADLVARLSVALRAESSKLATSKLAARPLPLVGRLSA